MTGYWEYMHLADGSVWVSRGFWISTDPLVPLEGKIRVTDSEVEEIVESLPDSYDEPNFY